MQKSGKKKLISLCADSTESVVDRDKNMTIVNTCSTYCTTSCSCLQEAVFYATVTTFFLFPSAYKRFTLRHTSLPEPWVVFLVSVSPNWPLMEAGEVYRALNTLVGPITSLQWRTASSLAKTYARIGPLWEKNSTTEPIKRILLCVALTDILTAEAFCNTDSPERRAAVPPADVQLRGDDSLITGNFLQSAGGMWSYCEEAIWGFFQTVAPGLLC